MICLIIRLPQLIYLAIVISLFTPKNSCVAVSDNCVLALLKATKFVNYTYRLYNAYGQICPRPDRRRIATCMPGSSTTRGRRCIRSLLTEGMRARYYDPGMGRFMNCACLTKSPKDYPYSPWHVRQDDLSSIVNRFTTPLTTDGIYLPKEYWLASPANFLCR